MQARAEATRRAILDAAVDRYSTAGFSNVSLTDLINQTGVTKGAFYYHFPNRESIAAAIIEEAEARLRNTALRICSDISYRRLENCIRTLFFINDLNRDDALVRTGIQLRGGLSHISTASDGFTRHRKLFTDAVAGGIAEGDLRADLNPDQTAHALWAAALGNNQHCAATGEDVNARLADVLLVILSGICTAKSTRHYGGFVSGLAAQHAG